MTYALEMATETSSTGRESDKFMLRLPDGMREEIKLQAEKNNRTMNAEIVARLDISLDPIGNMIATNDQAQWLYHSKQVQRLGRLGHAVKAMYAYWKSDKTQKALLNPALQEILKDAGKAIEDAEASTPEALSQAISEIEQSSEALKQLINDQQKALAAARKRVDQRTQ